MIKINEISLRVAIKIQCTIPFEHHRHKHYDNIILSSSISVHTYTLLYCCNTPIYVYDLSVYRVRTPDNVPHPFSCTIVVVLVIILLGHLRAYRTRLLFSLPFTRRTSSCSVVLYTPTGGWMTTTKMT